VILLNVCFVFSLIHFLLCFARYMAKQIPLAAVDVSAGVNAKFSDLVVDAGVSALRILLMGHAMEKQHVLLEAKHKEYDEDVEKWKHKVTGMDARLKDALKDKKATETEAGQLKEAMEALESENKALKTKVGELEKSLGDAQAAVEEGKGMLA
jgi:septal ring factor EnvC (AmiA/AmiB activator)